MGYGLLEARGTYPTKLNPSTPLPPGHNLNPFEVIQLFGEEEGRVQKSPGLNRVKALSSKT